MTALLSRALYHAMVNDPGIAAIVAARITPQPLPGTQTLPALTYYFMPRMPSMLTHRGDPGTETTLVQLDCWGNTYEQTQRLADAVKAAFHGRAGSIGVPPDEVGLGYARVRMMRDARDAASNKDRVIVDLEVNTYAVD